MQLEDINEKLHSKNMQGDVDRKVLEAELAKLSDMDKEKRLMNERVIDLEDEIKRLSDVNNGLNLRQIASEEEKGRLRNDIGTKDKKIDELKMRMRDLEKQNERMEHESERMRKDISKMTNQLEQTEAAISNKELFSKLKQEEEERAREEYRSLLC